MKNINLIKWLSELADGKPIVFSVVLLLIAVSVMSVVIVNRDGKIDSCDEDKKSIVKNYEIKIDSINRVNAAREIQHNLEMREALLSNIKDYKTLYEEQKALNQKINTTISKTSTLIRRNKSRTKNLRQ